MLPALPTYMPGCISRTRYVPGPKPTSGVAVGSRVASRMCGWSRCMRWGLRNVGVGTDVVATAEVGIIGSAVATRAPPRGDSGTATAPRENMACPSRSMSPENRHVSLPTFTSWYPTSPRRLSPGAISPSGENCCRQTWLRSRCHTTALRYHASPSGVESLYDLRLSPSFRNVTST